MTEEGVKAAADLRWIRAAKGVDARVTLWTCFYRVVIAEHFADMAKGTFCSKPEFDKWARSVNLAFHLPKAYNGAGKGMVKGRRPRKYFVAVEQFWRWYQMLFATSSALMVVEEKVGFGLAVRQDAKAERGCRDGFLRDAGLSGQLFEIAEADYEALLAGGYPSLFVAHGKFYILTGPLSLVNERCSFARTYLQWECDADRGEVWLKTRDGAHVFAAGERLWTRYEYGKRAVDKSVCFCPDSTCHR